MMGPHGMNPADVSIRPVDGGFVIEWLEIRVPDDNKRAHPPFGMGMGMGVQRREAVRGTMKDALKLVESVLSQKEMLRKAGKLDVPDDGPMMGGTAMFQSLTPPGFPPGSAP